MTAQRVNIKMNRTVTNSGTFVHLQRSQPDLSDQPEHDHLGGVAEDQLRLGDPEPRVRILGPGMPQTRHLSPAPAVG